MVEKGRGMRTERLLHHSGRKPGQQRLVFLLLLVWWEIGISCWCVDEAKMGFESKNFQSLVKEKTLFLSELGALAESVPPGVIRSLVKLKDKA